MRKCLSGKRLTTSSSSITFLLKSTITLELFSILFYLTWFGGFLGVGVLYVCVLSQWLLFLKEISKQDRSNLSCIVLFQISYTCNQDQLLPIVGFYHRGEGKNIIWSHNPNHLMSEPWNVSRKRWYKENVIRNYVHTLTFLQYIV